MLSRFATLGCLAALTLAARGTVHAHTPGLSTVVARIGPDRLDAELVFSIADAAEIVALDKDGDGKFSKEELTSGVMELQALAGQALEVKVDGRQVKAVDARCRFDEADNATVYLSFPATNFSTLTMCSSWLVLLQQGHRETFSLQNDKGETLSERMLNAHDSCVTLQLDASGKKPTPAPVVAGDQKPARQYNGMRLAGLALVALLVAGAVWLASRRQ